MSFQSKHPQTRPHILYTLYVVHGIYENWTKNIRIDISCYFGHIYVIYVLFVLILSPSLSFRFKGPGSPCLLRVEPLLGDGRPRPEPLPTALAARVRRLADAVVRQAETSTPCVEPHGACDIAHRSFLASVAWPLEFIYMHGLDRVLDGYI